MRRIENIRDIRRILAGSKRKKKKVRK